MFVLSGNARKSTMVAVLATIFAAQPAHSEKFMRKLTPEEISGKWAVKAKIYADVCHQQTGQFADDVRFFKAPSENGNRILISQSLYMDMIKKYWKGDWAKELSAKHQKQRIVRCKRALSFFKSKID